MQYKIEITPLAIELLSKIKDKREQEGLKKQNREISLRTRKTR
jgi:hypothetical protein